MKLIKTRKEGRVMNWETFYIQIHQQQGSLNDEESTPDTNPLCTIAPYARQHNDSITQSHAATAQFDTTGQHTHCITYRVSPSYYYLTNLTFPTYSHLFIRYFHILLQEMSAFGRDSGLGC